MMKIDVLPGKCRGIGKKWYQVTSLLILPIQEACK